MKYILIFCIAVACNAQNERMDLQEQYIDAAQRYVDMARIKQNAKDYKAADSLFAICEMYKAKADSIEYVRLSNTK